MGLFDDLTKTITKSGAAVIDKAKEVTEIASQTAAMEKEKIALEKLYNDLGKKMFENYKEELVSRFPEEVDKIEESLRRIAEAKENINDKKGNRICPACGKEIPKGSSFCTACGRRVTKSTPHSALPAAQQFPRLTQPRKKTVTTLTAKLNLTAEKISMS